MDCDRCGFCKEEGLPGGVLLHLLKSITHPVAVCSVTGHFVWVNEAYERLVGYSMSELKMRSYVDITVPDDLTGDMESVNSVLSGARESYTLFKRYRHKQGKEVPIQLTVWRWPPSGEIVFLIAEAPKVQASRADLETHRKEVQAEIEMLKKQLADSSVGQAMSKNETETHVVNVGNNSNDVLKWLVVAIGLLIAAVAYFAYIAGWPHHQGEAEPPQPPSINGK